MLLSSVRRNVVRSRSQIGLRHASAEEMEKYKTDSNMLAKWLDVSIVSKKGRAFEADKYLIVPSKADVFPPAKVYNLDGQSITIPTAIDAKAKLVVVSFKHYGFSLLRSWIDPFIAKFNTPALPASGNSGEIQDVSSDASTVVAGGLSNPEGAIAYEICFVEYSFLSMAKSMFLSNVKTTVHPSQVNRTGMIFGGVRVSHLSSHFCTAA